MTEMMIDPHWEYVADDVMGGVSAGRMTKETVKGRSATVLRGQVSLENNGGFVQIATDLPQDLVAEGWDGIALDVSGNDESYDIRLRTAQLTRPWQSFRADFVAKQEWVTIHLPFAAFEAHKHQTPFDALSLRRIGILAIGRVFVADIAIADVRLYRT